MPRSNYAPGVRAKIQEEANRQRALGAWEFDCGIPCPTCGCTRRTTSPEKPLCCDCRTRTNAKKPRSPRDPKPGRRSYSERVQQENRDLVRTYGITLAELKDMYARQGGCCALCKEPYRMPHDPDSQPRGKGSHRDGLVVDHCHKTGRVRGLLCNPCNFKAEKYEWVRDNPEYHMRLRIYTDPGDAWLET